MPDDSFVIERLRDRDEPTVRSLLVELFLEEQERYRHPRRSRQQIERDLPPLSTSFSGENHFFVARNGSGAPVAVCWCVLFDPGTGLEGEVAELYVHHDSRERGLAARLLREAVQLFSDRNVTFACVWTQSDNPAAIAAYRAAGFRQSEQTVLTWLPLP